MTVKEHARIVLDNAIAQRGLTYSEISRLIGKNPAYIQQFIKRGTPRRLDEQDRHKIASHLGIPENLLSDRPAPEPVHAAVKRAAKAFAVPRLSLGASAGNGNVVAYEEAEDAVTVDARLLRKIGVAPPHVSIISVDGESMMPTLNHGDEIMVDHKDDASRLRDGIYVLRWDDLLIVKRIAMGRRRGTFDIMSDNNLYPSWTDVDLAAVAIVGRVVWIGRMIR